MDLNLEKLYSISHKVSELREYIKGMTGQMERIQMKIDNAYRFLPVCRESTHEQYTYIVNNVERWLPQTIDDNLTLAKSFCERIENNLMKTNITKLIDSILTDLSACRESNGTNGMFEIERKTKQLTEYIRVFTKKYQSFRTKIHTVGVMLPNGQSIELVINDLSEYLPNAIDKNLKDMMRESDSLCEPYKSHIKTAIAPILKELQEFRHSAGNLSQSQNIYSVNISTSHGPGISKSQGGHHPVSYFALKQHVPPETMHQQERAEHQKHKQKVEERFAKMLERKKHRHHN
jgi:hypothetical protein